VVADGSITSAKLADGAVDSVKVAVDTLTSADLAPDSVGSSELAPSAVGASEIASHVITGNDVAFHSLGAAHVTSADGAETVDFGSIAAGACQVKVVSTAAVVFSTVIVATPTRDSFPETLVVRARGNPGPAQSFDLTACNISAIAVNPDPVEFVYAAFAI
jgi:hypothetical protein